MSSNECLYNWLIVLECWLVIHYWYSHSEWGHATVGPFEFVRPMEPLPRTISPLDFLEPHSRDLCKPQGLGDFIRSANMQDFLQYCTNLNLQVAHACSCSFHGSNHQPPGFGWWMMVSKFQFVEMVLHIGCIQSSELAVVSGRRRSYTDSDDRPLSCH